MVRYQPQFKEKEPAPRRQQSFRSRLALDKGETQRAVQLYRDAFAATRKMLSSVTNFLSPSTKPETPEGEQAVLDQVVALDPPSRLRRISSAISILSAVITAQRNNISARQSVPHPRSLKRGSASPRHSACSLNFRRPSRPSPTPFASTAKLPGPATQPRPGRSPKPAKKLTNDLMDTTPLTPRPSRCGRSFAPARLSARGGSVSLTFKAPQRPLFPLR